MPDLLAGTQVTAADTPPSVVNRNSTTVTAAGTGAEGWKSVSPEVSVTFTAPTSGRVEIVVGAGLRIDSVSGTRRAWAAPEVRQNNVSGTVVLSPGTVNRYGTSTNASSYEYGDRATLLTGLTPGGTYFARVMTNSSVDVAAYSIFERSIHVIPVS